MAFTSAFRPLTRRSFLAASTAAAAITVLPGTLRAQTPPDTPTGQVVIGIIQEPTVFNPLQAGIEVDESVWMQVYSPLWMSDSDGNLVPHLATEIPSEDNGGIAEDGTFWTVRLRDDVTWHDGTPFTAEDVAFTLELLNDDNFRAGNRQGHELVSEVTVVSPTEVNWRMSEAYAPYLALLCSTYIVPKHIVSEAADPNLALASAPVGTGPFRWESRTSGDNVTLKANLDYFGEGPYLDTVIFKHIATQTTLYAQFRTGQVDITIGTSIPANNYEEAAALPGVNIELAPNASIEFLMPNLEHPALADKAVRQALYKSIDAESIIDVIFFGLHHPTSSFAPRQSWAYKPDLAPHEFDVEGAIALLEDAGWVPGGDGVREKDDVRLEFELSTTTGNALREQAQQLMIQIWESIGIKVNINNMPAAVIWGDFYRLSQFDSLLVGTTFRTGPDPDPSNGFLSSAIPAQGGAGGNYMQWRNEEADEIMIEAMSTFDQDRRQELYFRLQEIVRDELPILPIYQYSVIEGRKEDLQGYQPNIYARQNTWNLSTWFWS